MRLIGYLNLVLCRALIPALLIVGLALPGSVSGQTQIGSDIDGEGPEEYFGFEVAMSMDGSRLAVLAPDVDVDDEKVHRVRVFRWNGTEWKQFGSDLTGKSPGDKIDAVSMSPDGNWVAVGSVGGHEVPVRPGYVRLYEWSGNDWRVPRDDIADDEYLTQFGRSLSLSADGNRLVVGAPQDGVAGLTRVYQWTGSEWTQLGQTIEGEAPNDSAGWPVVISGDGARLAVAARNNDANGSQSGHVRVFEWQEPAWVQIGSDIDGDAEGDKFGSALAWSADGSRLVVGASTNDGGGFGFGQVKVFSWNGVEWSQLGQELNGMREGEAFGWSVDISSDGKLLAVGAHALDAGFVHVFQWSGTEWAQLGDTIEGEDFEDNSGFSIALSGDGNRLAIGAPTNDGNGIDSGQVRVYSLEEFAVPNQMAFTGLFYDAANPGHGFNFSVHEAGFTLIYYGHTYNGERLWLISEPFAEDIEFDMPYSLEMYEVVSGAFGQPSQPESFWGYITFTMSDCDTGHASLSGGDGAFEMDFERLAGLPGVQCHH